MNVLSVVMLSFAIIGAIDRIFGNRFGLGTEFERGFYLLGVMALTMVGMLVISPVLADLLAPVFDGFYSLFGIDPSIIPASLFANDMGGASLSKEIGKTAEIGLFNGLVVSSMMGCTISFTIPFALGIVEKKNHKALMIGILCGIITIPFGCAIVGLIMGLPIVALLLNLLPLLIFSGIVAIGLGCYTEITVKLFSILGILIKALITIGLLLGMLKEILGFEPVKGLASIKDAAWICFNASIFLAGAFPLMKLVSKLLKRPLKIIGKRLGVNEESAFGLVSTLVTNATTLEKMRNMDKKGITLNAAFLTSAAFTFGGHLAFTMAFDQNYLFPMIGAKLISGVFAFLLALVIYKKIGNKID